MFMKSIEIILPIKIYIKISLLYCLFWYYILYNLSIAVILKMPLYVFFQMVDYNGLSESVLSKNLITGFVCLDAQVV